jgi:hypothetical protein
MIGEITCTRQNISVGVLMLYQSKERVSEGSSEMGHLGVG